ncbi:hypothetical protein B0T21DRAFT_351819 [Apiosordaria backusii]|uniref:Uncharacterized protein n=1 Tax=Apiosordaria backusii TaxID=314023 RepID=A0AA40E1C0_9PEZI|nr:hypothetical protein B0T21DRAFT_351819 [Apiosordaria backusii]
MAVSLSLQFPLIKTLHRESYPAISPLRLENNQAGKTVLVTGGAGGVGFAIAKAFVQASASHVIIVGRRQGFIQDGVKRLEAEARAAGTDTKISGYSSDVADQQASENLWAGLKENGIVVDVLVLNAMALGPTGPLVDADLESVWKAYEVNTRSLLDHTQRFYKQEGGKQKYLVSVSSSMVHNLDNENSFLAAYGATKNAGQVLIQQIARDVDPEKLQIISFHPGAIYSEGAQTGGVTKDMIDVWDDALPGNFAVWAATPEAKFLHGRFLAAWWDVNELQNSGLRQKLESDWHLLRYDPIKDFCRRFGHQSAVVDNRLYIDGGLVNWKPFTSLSPNYTNPFLTFSDLSTETKDMPTLYASLSKNATVPSVMGGKLWEDSVNKRLYLYGGETYQAPPTNFLLYAYDILKDKWDSFGPPTGTAAIIPTSFGAGVSVPARGEAYYYGGFHNNASVPGWTGPPRASNRLIKYDMDTNAWSNVTGPDEVRRAEGEMFFLPLSDAGMLVYFGGSQDLFGNGTLTPEPLDTIFLYDLANGKWYAQKASGRIPENRRRFCGGATWAQDQSSYNMFVSSISPSALTGRRLTACSYIYGGSGFPPSTAGYDDIYVLTIPSFQWIRGPYPKDSNITGPFPKNMMSCNVVNNAQMVIVGGSNSNATGYECDVDVVGGQHNMNLGQENPEKAIWARYQPKLTTYAVPTFIMSAVGGRNTGGARVLTPSGGFNAPDLSVLMTRKAIISTRTPTRDVSLATSQAPSSTGGPEPAPPLSPGAIAGIAVGGAVVLIALLGGCCCFIRYRQKHYKGPRQPSHGVPPHGWGPSGPLSPASPAVTHISYAHTVATQPQSPVMLPSIPVYPPAELGTNDNDQYRTARTSPASVAAKHDNSPWATHASTPQTLEPPTPASGPYPNRTPSYTERDPRTMQPGQPYWSTTPPQLQQPQFRPTQEAQGEIRGWVFQEMGRSGTGRHHLNSDRYCEQIGRGQTIGSGVEALGIFHNVYTSYARFYLGFALDDLGSGLKFTLYNNQVQLPNNIHKAYQLSSTVEVR